MLTNPHEVSEKIDSYIRANVQCIQLVVGGQTNEALIMLAALARARNWALVQWNPATGFSETDATAPCVNPVLALDAVLMPKSDGANGGKAQVLKHDNAIMVFHDMHHALHDIAALMSSLKLGISRNGLINSMRKRPVFLITTNTTMTSDILPYIKVIEMALPDRNKLEFIFTKVRGSLPMSKQECNDDLKWQIVNSLSGLTCPDAENVMSEAIVKHGMLCSEICDTIEEEKGLLLKKSEVLTYTPKSNIMAIDDLGGFAELKTWVNQRRVAYSPEAENLGLDMPKGLVIVGVPGTGKSQCAQVIARELQQPLIRFDIGAVFNSLVGESERRTRETIKIADALNGCVLLIDEADKVLGGANESTGDSGVTRRIFGQILTWLSEKKSKTFVVLTMNRIAGMPPELMRRGRFDEIFFVDTPDESERRQIFEIHMRRRGIMPSLFSTQDWCKIIDSSEGFVGAEIEQAIVASRFAAYSADNASRGVFDASGLVVSLKDLIPITKVDPENIEQIRAFGRNRARNVSGRKTTVVQHQSRAVDLSFRDPNI